MIYGVNTDGAYWHAIVSGMIGDYGPAVSIGPNGQVDPAHNSEMSLWLTHRSLAPRRRAAVWLEPPTGCELEVLRLLAAARSNQRIAHDLVV